MTIRSHNDAMRTWLANQGQTTGHNLDRWKAHLGVINGTDGNAADLIFSLLRSYSYTGAAPDMWRSYLKDKTGRAGNVSDLETKYFNATGHMPLESSTNSVDELAQVSAITYDRSGDATYRTNAAGLLATAGSDVARYEYGSGLAKNGLLVEQARTNYVTESEDLGGTTWAASNATVTADQKVSPTGSTTADILLNTDAGTAIGTLSNVYAQGSSLAGMKWLFSVWLAGTTTGGTCTIEMVDNDAVSVTSDVTLGTSLTRYWFSGNFTGTTITSRIHIGHSSGTGPADAVYAWGAQTQQDAQIYYADSYIANSGTAPITRPAENVQMGTAPTSFAFDTGKATVCIEYETDRGSTTLTGGSGSPTMWYHTNTAGTGTSNYLWHQQGLPGFRLNLKTGDGTDLACWSTAFSIDKGSYYRVIATWNNEGTVTTVGGTDYYLTAWASKDGGAWGEVDTFSNGNLAWNAAAQNGIIHIGRDPNIGSRYAQGIVRNIKFFDRSMTLADAQKAWGRF